MLQHVHVHVSIDLLMTLVVDHARVHIMWAQLHDFELYVIYLRV